MRRAILTISLSLGITLIGSAADAASPTYYGDRVVFEGEFSYRFTDGFDQPPYDANTLSDAQMSAVLGQTQFRTTGSENGNFASGFYSGNGSFELSFPSTDYGNEIGVRAVGIDVNQTNQVVYYAFITFGDGTTANLPMPPAPSFWGVSADERIQSIHFGRSAGEATTEGYFAIDNLVIGDHFDESPCGDGIVHSDEQCDDAGQSSLCEASCRLAVCGDTILNSFAHEDCDDGGVTSTCNADCTAATCGDGILNVLAGEDCDIGAGETATCDSDCTMAFCGDGRLNVTAGELCDDSAQSPECEADCTPVVCGDGIENNVAGEYCDDGNNEDGDGCSATCSVEPGSDDEGSSGAVESSDGDSSGSDPTSSGSGDDTTGGNEGSSNTSDDPSGSTSATSSTTDVPADTSGDGSSNGDGSSSSDGSAAAQDNGGCGCTSEPTDRGIAWSTLGLLGLGLLARRRR